MKSASTKFRELMRRPTWRLARKVVVAIVGGSVLIVGLAMVVLPGPAFLVIPLGLAILATRFLWAKRWLTRAKALLPGAQKSPPPSVAGRSKAWHELSIEDVLANFHSSADRLSVAEAAKRLAAAGPNVALLAQHPLSGRAPAPGHGSPDAPLARV